MSILNRLNQLNNECVEQICGFYDEFQIPFYVRRIYAEEIERAVCGPMLERDTAVYDFDVDLPQANHMSDLEISVFISSLICDLENRLNGQGERPSLDARLQVSKHFPALKILAENEPLVLYSMFRHCVQLELNLIRTQRPMMNPSDLTGQALNATQLRIARNDQILKQLEGQRHSYGLSVAKRQAILHEQEKRPLAPDEVTMSHQTEESINETTQTIQQLQHQIAQNSTDNVRACSTLRNSLYTDHIVLWKSQQQRLLNGSPLLEPLVSLEKVQKWYEELVSQILSILQQIRQFDQMNQHLSRQDPILSIDLSDIETEAKEILTLLVNNCFLVHNPPPQVMKKGTKFTKKLSVCLLLGKQFGIDLSTPSVSVSIINDFQARLVTTFIQTPGSSRELSSHEKSGELKNPQQSLFFDEVSKRFIADFQHDTLLNSITRSDRRGSATECVMEEKFCLCFTTTVKIGDVEIRAYTLSLPVVVTSHGTQEALAVATIIWDNAFGGILRLPFAVPHEVPWDQLAQVISNRFLQVTGMGLNEKHIQFLKNKAFRGRDCPDNELLSWHDFCKESLPGRTFSFWDWVHGVLRLFEKKETKMREMWSSNLIEGFIAKEEAELLIRQYNPGYFLLRFSESLVGAILIVWNGIYSSQSVEPFELQKLTETKTKLADRLKRFTRLQYLYPSMKPKDEVFQAFYSTERRADNGYVRVETELREDSRNGQLLQPDVKQLQCSMEADQEMIWKDEDCLLVNGMDQTSDCDSLRVNNHQFPIEYIGSPPDLRRQ